IATSRELRTPIAMMVTDSVATSGCQDAKNHRTNCTKPAVITKDRKPHHASINVKSAVYLSFITFLDHVSKKSRKHSGSPACRSTNRGSPHWWLGHRRNSPPH